MQERFDYSLKEISFFLQTKTDDFLMKIAPFGVEESQHAVKFLASWGMQSMIEELYEFVMSQLAEYDESVYDFELLDSAISYVRGRLVYGTAHHLNLDFIDSLNFINNEELGYVLMKFPDRDVELLREAFESADERTKKEYLESECVKVWLTKLEIIGGKNSGNE